MLPDCDIHYINLHSSSKEKSVLRGSCTSIYSKITLCLYLELQCSCCVWKSFRASLAFCCLWTWNFLPNNWMQAALKLLRSEGFVDNSWTPCDWLHDSSFRWNRTFGIHWLFSSVNARTCAREHSRWLETARPERSAPQRLPAAEMVRVFDCFRVLREDLLWWWPTVCLIPAWARWVPQLWQPTPMVATVVGMYHVRSCMHINTGEHNGRKQVGLAGARGFRTWQMTPPSHVEHTNTEHVVFKVSVILTDAYSLLLVVHHMSYLSETPTLQHLIFREGYIHLASMKLFDFMLFLGCLPQSDTLVLVLSSL